MPLDEMTSARLQPLREAIGYLDRTPIPEHDTLATRAAAGALVRARSLLRAIVALVEAPGVKVPEVDVLVRVLLEMAITMAWIGTDEKRAALHRDHGVKEARRWREEMARHGATLDGRIREMFDAYIAEGTGGSLPSLPERATHTRREEEPAEGWISLDREYDFIYRRLCAAVHHDDRLQALIEPVLGEGALALTLNAAKIATGVLLTSACETLGMRAGWACGMNLAFNPGAPSS
jgi:hypothetical protein